MTEPGIEPRSPRELASSRVIDATPARLFEAFRDPVQLATWWGPRGFRSTFHTFEFEPGGAWNLTMIGPDGTEYPNEARFVELEEPSRIVIRHLAEPLFNAEIDLRPVERGTRVEFRQVFDSVDVCRKIAAFAGDANEQNLERLAALVAGC